MLLCVKVGQIRYIFAIIVIFSILTFCLIPLYHHRNRTSEHILGDQLNFNQTLQIFTLNGRGIIWAFYDIDRPPVHIRLSLATVICHNSPKLAVIVVYQHNIGQYLPNVHEKFDKLIPAHKADYFRAHILAKYGGVYIDSDTLACRSIYEQFQKLQTYELINIDWQPEGALLSIGVIGPWRANSQLAIQWVKEQDTILTTTVFGNGENYENYPLAWAQLASKPLLRLVNSLLTNNNSSNHHQLLSINGVATFGQWLRLYPDIRPNARIRELNVTQVWSFTETEMLMYYGSHLNWMDYETVDELWKEDFVFNEMVAMSMQRCREKTKNGKLETFPASQTYEISSNNIQSKDDNGLLPWILHYMAQVDMLTDMERVNYGIV